MPKKQKPSYKLHKPSGQARARIDGHSIYLGVYGSPESRERYDDLIAEWFARNGDASRYSLTVDDLSLLFVEHAKAYYLNVNTGRKVHSCLSQHSGVFCASSRHFSVRESEIRRVSVRVSAGNL